MASSLSGVWGGVSVAAVIGALGLGSVACSGASTAASESPFDGARDEAALSAEETGASAHDWTCEYFFPGQGASFGTGGQEKQARDQALSDCINNHAGNVETCLKHQCIDFNEPPSSSRTSPRLPAYKPNQKGTGGGLGYRCKITSRVPAGSDVPERVYSALAPTAKEAEKLARGQCLGDRSYCEDQSVACFPVLSP